MILAALYVSSIGQKSIPRVPNPTPDGIPMRLRLPRVSYVFTWTKVYQSLSQIAGLVSWRFCKSQSFGKALLHLDLILAGNGWPASYRFDSSVVFFLPCGTTPSSCAQYCVFFCCCMSHSQQVGYIEGAKGCFFFCGGHIGVDTPALVRHGEKFWTGPCFKTVSIACYFGATSVERKWTCI
jgi:hypothetical protein